MRVYVCVCVCVCVCGGPWQPSNFTKGEDGACVCVCVCVCAVVRGDHPNENGRQHNRGRYMVCVELCVCVLCCVCCVVCGDVGGLCCAPGHFVMIEVFVFV